MGLPVKMTIYLQKLQNLRLAVKQQGGLINAFLALYRMDEIKPGKLVGEDKYGNKYFENNMYFVGTNRWVQYADQYGMDYDGSQVPAEWHRWLHNITDAPPTEVPSPANYKWLPDHKENFSGVAEKEYVPYSTTRPKIQAWSPPKKSDKAYHGLIVLCIWK